MMEWNDGSPIELEGKNLGEKHRCFNFLVKEAITNETCKLDVFNADEGDIENLLKIDVANKERNVEFILKVLVYGDMLYVSRVIKNCPWLITEDVYSHIVNPEYLYSSLFPQMKTKSVIKFTKQIQLHLKDEIRVEEFYKYEKKPEIAVHWLPNCSPKFILQNIVKHEEHLKITLIRKLCQKTMMVLETIVAGNCSFFKTKVFEAIIVLWNAGNINKYLDFVEMLHVYEYPKFGKAATNFMMKLAPTRIIDKFENYCNFIHLPTFIKFIKNKSIKTFLLDLASRMSEQNQYTFMKNKILSPFFESMPYDERSHLIKQIFIDKIHQEKNSSLSDSEIKAMTFIYSCVTSTWYNQFQIYQYAPFQVALSHVKELIEENPQRSDKNDMFSMLIACAKHNVQNINLILQYFQVMQFNNKYELRYQFVKDIISQTNFHKFDQQLWDVLESIMMIDIVDSNNEIQVFVEAIIIYKLLHSQIIPEVIGKKFDFNSLNVNKSRFNLQEKVTIFNFLYNHLLEKFLCHTLENEQQLNATARTLDKLLNLLNDWNKDLREYPLLITKIKELINVKKQNSWNSDLSFLYNKNKSWRKWLFEESFVLCPSQAVFVNAIKHDPTMFERYKSEAEESCIKEKETLIYFLRKIKLYWPQSLTKAWIEFYTNKLNDINSQKASSRGICVMLPRAELIAILNKNAPENAKIDYDNINEVNLNLQRCFAKHMHIARPQPPADIILLYAKGDYLNYSLPSLLSIYYNLSKTESFKYISMLLIGQVSLQKHGIRFSLNKMKTSEITSLFANIWQTSKNTTIRSVLFKTVHHLLCKEKDPLDTETLWELLEMFIDNLTFHENKNVYDTLLKIPENTETISAKFFIKSYDFLKSLHASKNEEFENYGVHVRTTLFPYSKKIIDALPTPFVVNMLLEYISDDFINDCNKYNNTLKESIISVLSAYLLSSKDEDIQMRKYEEVFVVLIQRHTSLINNKNVCMRNLEGLLYNLSDQVQFYCFNKKMILPMKMFTAIQNELKKVFSESENYLVLTKWELTVAFIKSLDGHQGDSWDELCNTTAPQFGKQCLQILQEHCQKYFPRIYILFANALNSVLNAFIESNINALLEICNCFLQDKDFIQGQLTILLLYPDYILRNDDSKEKVEKLQLIISQHPSLEVKMHCNNKFNKSRT